MIALSIFIVVIVVVIAAVAFAARRRRFEDVARGAGRRLSIRRPAPDMIPTPEEVTREAAEHAHEYDAQDDRLDPHHGDRSSGHADPEVP
ncbi:MAG TPA: DUF6479 family protein [Acidimicrobiales bacterium]|nr:DUF6479 family protein [Acidimicrobiales bacterium]